MIDFRAFAENYSALCSQAKNILESYLEHLELELKRKLVQFNAFLKDLKKGGALSYDNVGKNDTFLLIDDNSKNYTCVCSSPTAKESICF